MPGPRHRLVLDLVKFTAVVVLFLAIQAEIQDVRHSVSRGAHRLTDVKQCYALALRDLQSTRRVIEGSAHETRHEIVRLRESLDRSARTILGQGKGLENLLRDQAETVTGLFDENLQGTQLAAEASLVRAQEIEWEVKGLTRRLEADPFRMKEAMIYPTVQMRGNGTVGSGVIVYSMKNRKGKGHETFILSAYHVVLEVTGADGKEPKRVKEVRTVGPDNRMSEQVYTADLVLFDAERDTALLRLNTDRRFEHVAEMLPKGKLHSIDIFSRAYAVGCPLGNVPMPSIGEISSTSKRVGDQTFWMISAPTYFGNSGGGIFLADGYQLIGVSSMIYTYGKVNPTVVPHMGLFVPVRSIYDWLDASKYSFVYEEEASRLAGGETKAPSPEPGKVPPPEGSRPVSTTGTLR